MVVIFWEERMLNKMKKIKRITIVSVFMVVNFFFYKSIDLKTYKYDGRDGFRGNHLSGKKGNKCYYKTEIGFM